MPRDQLHGRFHNGGEQIDTYARFGRYQADDAEFIDGTPPRTDDTYPAQKKRALINAFDLACWIAGVGLLGFLVRACMEAPL